MASFRYALRDGSRLIFRHWMLSLLTILTSMAVFFLIGASILFVMNARSTVSLLESELNIQAYLKEDGDPRQVAKEVASFPGVRKVDIVTPQMAMERLKARLGDQSGALTLLGENPLPPSLEVYVKRAADVEIVARDLATLPQVQDVVYAGKLAEKFARLSAFASQLSLVVLLVSIATGGVVLFNTIRIAVYSREEEIRIMLAVGATPSFVALPYVFQGIVLGGVGALLASLLLAASYWSLLNKVGELLPFLPLINDMHLLIRLGGVLIGAGATVSLIASLLAVERFIRKALKPL